MSEKREGWLGWMSERGTTFGDGRYDYANVAAKESRDYPIPVWVQPIEPDGPKPGETWMSRHGQKWRYRIMSPPIEGWVLVVEAEQEGLVYPYRIEELSPIPTTRTVTVELTEEEARYAKTAGSIIPERQSLFDKLAAALEDE